MDIKPIKTEDGSHSLYVPELDEHYHSTKGAIQESKHIFVEAGLKFLDKTEIEILEIGFGTGLNAYLTVIENENLNRKIKYTGLEKYPLGRELTTALNFPEEIKGDRNLFEELHAVEWGKMTPVTENFHLCKVETDLNEWDTENQFDLIYFDAFGPDKQPEMWTEKVFQLMGKVLRPGGVLVTYSAKGDVRRGFQSAGMEIQKIPGPPGKKHMTRAIKL